MNESKLETVDGVAGNNPTPQASCKTRIITTGDRGTFLAHKPPSRRDMIRAGQIKRDGSTKFSRRNP